MRLFSYSTAGRLYIPSRWEWRAGVVLAVLTWPLAFGGSLAGAAPGPPLVSEEAFSEVGVSSASVTAQVDDEGNPGPEVDGKPHPPYYVYEYGPCPEPYEAATCKGSPYPSKTFATDLGEVNEDLAAPAQLSELEKETYYHFRIAATDVYGTQDGAEETFRTYPSTVSSLPDGRVYEMVTPVENQNANVYRPANGRHENGVLTYLPFEAAADGNGVAYVGEPTLGGNGSVGRGGGNEYLATRAPVGGWEQHYIQRAAASAIAARTTYQGFSSDLSVGIVVSCEESLALAAHAPGEGYGVLYAQTFGDEHYRPLFSFATPLAGQAAEDFGTVGLEGNAPSACPNENGGFHDIVYAGASADLGHMLFEANARLTPGAAGGNRENNLYDSVGGRLNLVNVLPPTALGLPGAPAPNATFGGPPYGVEIQGAQPDFSHVISNNGSRIFWTDLKNEHVYVRENDTVTVPVSEGPARFWTATPNGRYVFYTEEERLLRFDVDSETREELAGAGAGVEGVIGVNEAGEQGSYIYFVAKGVLTGQANREGHSPTAGEPNLYLRHGGETTFITTLDGGVLRSGGSAERTGGEDNYIVSPPGNIFPAGDWQSGLGGRTAEVSSDGQAVVFMSYRSLTGYENFGGLAIGGVKVGEAEVYVYEAGSGALFCASCDPSREPAFQLPAADFGEKDGYVPISNSYVYQPRLISPDGERVFFDSEVPLVPQDTNDAQDVYEWERDGAGSCHESGGCVYLLSGGTSSTASWLLDASESGDDVFIITRAQLVPQDKNENYNVYDVRVGGVQPLSPSICSGTGCQGVPPAPPLFATPATVTFGGVGNFAPGSSVTTPPSVGPTVTPLTQAQKLAAALKACRAERGRKRAVCEAHARKRYGSKTKTKKDGKAKKIGRGAGQ
jgi:hypothetical protein